MSGDVKVTQAQLKATLGAAEAIGIYLSKSERLETLPMARCS
jgi:hypothetical protein